MCVLGETICTIFYVFPVGLWGCFNSVYLLFFLSLFYLLFVLVCRIVVSNILSYLHLYVLSSELWCSLQCPHNFWFVATLVVCSMADVLFMFASVKYCPTRFDYEWHGGCLIRELFILHGYLGLPPFFFLYFIFFWGRFVLVIFLVFCVVLCLFVLFVFVLCLVYSMLSVSLVCPFLISPSVFSRIYW